MSENSSRLQTLPILERILEETLDQLLRTGLVFERMEACLENGDLPDLTGYVAELGELRSEAVGLAERRAECLASTAASSPNTRNDVPESVAPADSARLETLRGRLRHAWTALNEQRARVWSRAAVRAHVVDLTLRVLTGGSSHAYGASGEKDSPGGRAILQQWC